MKRIVEHRAYEYTRQSGGTAVACRGEEVDTSGWTEASLARAVKHGVFRSKDDIAAEAAKPDVSKMGAAELGAFIKSEKLNGKATIALAHGDAGRAKVVLEAEKLATRGASRKTVVEALATFMGSDDRSTSTK